MFTKKCPMEVENDDAHLPQTSDEAAPPHGIPFRTTGFNV